MIIQTVLSIPILVKTLINTEGVNQIDDSATIEDETATLQEKNTIFGDYLTAKGYKIIYENVLFIVYETWRLWILTDGVNTMIKFRSSCVTLIRNSNNLFS